MVQRKVSYCKLGIQGITSSNTLITHKIHDSNTKLSSNQNNHHDHHISTTTIGADFKPIKMKKSRTIKRSDVDISLRLPLRIHDTPRHPGKSSCSPNYMKSTRSFEARKESTAASVVSSSSISGTSKAAKTLTNLSSFKKVRSLKKAPSLKLKQPARTAEKTCSSAQKDSKFPPVLELNPGATEAKGKSVLRVCMYNYCSLNDHHHKSAPPLKRFVSLRRRLLKTERTTQRPVLSPRKKRLSERKGGGGDNQHEDFFVEILVPDRGVDQQVSESFSDGPCSEIDLQDEREQTEGTKSSDLKFTPKEEDYPPTPVQSDQLSICLDEFICENSELEWEEGHILTANEIHETNEIYIQNKYNDDQGKPGFDTEDSNDENFGEGHEYPAYFYDEIVEYLCFSDAYSLPDSESTKTGEREDSTLEDEATIRAAEVQEESIDNQDRVCSELTEEITAAANEDLDSYQDPVEAEGDESNEDDCIIGETREENGDESNEDCINGKTREENSTDTENLETSISTANNNDRECNESYEDDCIIRESRDENAADKPTMTVDLEDSISTANTNDREGSESIEDDCVIGENKAENTDEKMRMTENSETSFCTANNNDQDSTDQSDEENSAEEIFSSEVKLESNEDNVVEVNTSSGMGEFNGESDSNEELPESCSKLRKGMRYKKDDEDAEQDREFNPRGPNFLELEPEPEAEKVDLRHQELDDRRNAEDWMIDLALQKTVNQLTPARKKKVALLVEAYETVLPIPKSESNARRDSSVL